MDFERNNLKRPMLIEDRLSDLPDELIHQIFSYIDTKFVVQTCLLSPRWKTFWRSMPCLTFSSQEFDSLPEFSKFVTNVLSRRNHQIDVSSVKLSFDRAASQVFVRKIARYAFSHNVQQLTVISRPQNHQHLPLCLFGSKSLKHFTFRNNSEFKTYFYAPKTPLDFPVLTTLHLSNVTLRGKDSGDSIDLFSKCVNLKDLTLKNFLSNDVAAFDIITPRLENLMLINCKYCHVDAVNVIALQLENLTVINCSIKYLNAPPVISNFCYKNDHPLQLPNHCFHSLNKVTLALKLSRSNMPYKEEDARETINMLQKLHSARFLTINLDIVECLSSFPDLVSHHPSPFSNLICLNIDSSREEAYKVKLSTETINYLLENSPNATFITDLPEELPTKEMLEKEATEKKANLITEIKRRVMELQASVEQENMLLIERNQAKENTKASFGSLVANLLPVLTMKKMMQTDSNKSVQIEAELARLTVSIQACVGRLQDLYQQEYKNFEAIHSKELQIISLLKNLPTRQRTEYSRQLKVTEILDDRLLSTLQEVSSCKKKIIDIYKEHVSHNISTFQDIARVPEDWAKRSQHFKILLGFLKIGRRDRVHTKFHEKG